MKAEPEWWPKGVERAKPDGPNPGEEPPMAVADGTSSEEPRAWNWRQKQGKTFMTVLTGSRPGSWGTPSPRLPLH